MPELIFVTVCPDNLYFHWQTEVYITNFLKHGIPPERIHCIYLVDKNYRHSQGLEFLRKKYPIKWFIYDHDQAEVYQSLNVFKGLKQHVSQMEGKRVFFHDADMIFLRPPSLPSLEAIPINKWYGSDTKSYNSAKYLKAKNKDCFRGMCKIVGISPELVESKDNQVIGAQYIFDGMSKEFWDKCESDARAMWEYLGSHPSQQGIDKKKQIQRTCLMWSKLWNAWLFGIETEIRPELAFTFSSAKIEKCENVPILHNAGIVDVKDKVRFCKMAWRNKSPFGQDLRMSGVITITNKDGSIKEKLGQKDYAAYRYVEAIKEVEGNTII